VHAAAPAAAPNPAHHAARVDHGHLPAGVNPLAAGRALAAAAAAEEDDEDDEEYA